MNNRTKGYLSCTSLALCALAWVTEARSQTAAEPLPSSVQESNSQTNATTATPSTEVPSTPDPDPASTRTPTSTPPIPSEAETPIATQTTTTPALGTSRIDLDLVDATLRGAALDLGLVVHQLVKAQVLTTEDYLTWEQQLPRPDSDKITLGALLIQHTSELHLRLVALNDEGFMFNVTTPVDASNLEVATVRALTQLSKQFTPAREHPPTQHTGAIVPLEDPSQGKATLAAAGALFGGYLGFAIENVGGSADAALVYPLVALGAGVGVATALVAAEEWPVSRPRAWYIAGGGFWLTGAAVLVAYEQDLAHASDRYPYGLIGTAVGIGVASAVSSYREVSEPQALLSHEGGAFGTLAGGLIDRLVNPDDARLPALGMGVGGSVGWLTASLIGPFLLPELSSSRVLFAGLGGSLGALAGAAVASPALVNADRREPKKEGILFASALGGLVLGSVVGYWFGESDPPTTHSGTNAPAMRTPHTSSTSPIQRLTPSLSTTVELMPSSPYALRLPNSTNLTLSGTW